MPHLPVPYIDDIPIKAPQLYYLNSHGTHEKIPENAGIWQFVWEHFQGINCIVQHMKYSSGTFSGFKLALCTQEITVLGHRCTPEGRLPDVMKVNKITNWSELFDLTNVQVFLGTIGVCRMFIKNFAHRAHHLVKLTCKEAPFEYGQPQIEAQADLKQVSLTSPALRPIDSASGATVVLAVDTSYIAVGYILGQCDPEHTKTRYFS